MYDVCTSLDLVHNSNMCEQSLYEHGATVRRRILYSGILRCSTGTPPALCPYVAVALIRLPQLLHELQGLVLVHEENTYRTVVHRSCNANWRADEPWDWWRWGCVDVCVVGKDTIGKEEHNSSLRHS
ncbi:unnamed protein product [Tuber aestivum]|uniref:Uncharacterized protein n=1 Tax=Tuber aestivum TaxID=59557 RepID=A0A292PKH6_9PEZI|nr:unnamed protein product [Tuber aestivum]